MAASSSFAAPAGHANSGPHLVARASFQSSPSVKSGSHAPTFTQKPSGQVPLSRRLLFPHLAPCALLPSLLASPDAPPELDGELYDFVALALRAFVNPWWTKLTRYDKDFLPQVTRILVAVFRALEARVLAADLSPLVFQDLPALITQHYRDYRNAADKVNTSYAAGGAAPLPQLFHQIQPHMAVNPDGIVNEEYIRQAVDHILKTCLPPEDYEPETERFIVREIIIKVLLGSVVPKLVQPWFIQKTILDLLGPSSEKDAVLTTGDTETSRRRSFSLQSLIVLALSAVQAVSGFGLALIHSYRQARDIIKTINQSSPSRPVLPRTPSPGPPTSAPGGLPLSHSQGSSVESACDEKDSASAFDATNTPKPVRRTSTFTSPWSRFSDGSSASPPFEPTGQPASPSMPSLGRHYARSVLALLDETLQMHTRNASAAVIGALEMAASASQLFLDKLLPYILYTYVLSGAQTVNIVRLAKRALFPDGWPAPPPMDPTPEEQVAIRTALVKRLTEYMRGPAGTLLLGPDVAQTIETTIDPLSSQECNTHLMLLIIDMFLLTLFPEMGVGGANPDDV